MKCSAMRGASMGWRNAIQGSRRGVTMTPIRTITNDRRTSQSRNSPGTCSSCHSSARRLHTTPNRSSQSSPASDNFPEQFRSIMRLLSNPVVVLTAYQSTTPRAMTMSSFTSLSLIPTPLISFNVLTPSRTFDALESSAEFNIHILSPSIHGADLADRFTRGSADDVFEGLELVKEGNAPMIRSEGVLYVLKCRLAQKEATERPLVRVRDHVMVVAEVMEVKGGDGGGDYGLAYANRAYRTVGQSIKAH